ncbi:MAG TPA: acyl-CoA dehydrogenase [bacterium]|nr:acyl-CoA dehydrogenase [bacterium]
MPDYRVDIRDIKFVLNEQLGLDKLCELPVFQERGFDAEMLNDMVEQARKMAVEVLAPINEDADQIGAKYNPETCEVTLPESFKAVYKTYVENGWGSGPSNPEYGGMGMPELMNTCAGEIFTGACTSFTMLPGLSKSASAVIDKFGSDDLKNKYLEKMLTGVWAGTMCLTEPGAGSDVGASKTMATPIEGKDGWYKIVGTKCFITFGDHNMTENIIHLVLARTPGAPAGTKGIGLFIVPKYKINDDGSSGEANDVVCGGIEEKMGIHGSPTCTLNFGDNNECEGELIGDVYSGMKYMFLMMNEERLMVGMQGQALAQSAYQFALKFAQERVQGSDIRNFKDPDAPKVTIDKHPDVRRMLLTQKARTESMRALLYSTAYYIDLAHNSPDEKEAEKYDGWVELLTPICKAYCSDNGFDCCHTAMQCEGGYGYCTEYGTEVNTRDCKITAIYEGTNGIQALDLLGRKMAMKKGAVLMSFVMELNNRIAAMKKNEKVKDIAVLVESAKSKLDAVMMKFMALSREKSMNAFVPLINACGLLEMFGDVVCGVLIAEQAAIAAAKLDEISSAKGVEDDKGLRALVADNIEAKFYFSKVKTAEFYVKNLLPRVFWREAGIMNMDLSCMDDVFEQLV